MIWFGPPAVEPANDAGSALPKFICGHTGTGVGVLMHVGVRVGPVGVRVALESVRLELVLG